MSDIIVLKPDEISEIWRKASEIADLPLDSEENIDAVKEVVCSFYENFPDIQKPMSLGGCGGCRHRDVEHIAGCRDVYLSKIYDKPYDKWCKDFDEPIEREKVSPSISSLGLRCDSCHVSRRCPEFKANSLCGIDWEDQDASEMSNKEIVSKLITLQYKRVTREVMFEDIDGGKSDPTVSSEMDRLDALVMQRNNLDVRKAKLTIETTESHHSDDGVTESKPSLLASLFGGAGKSNENDKPNLDQRSDVIDISELQTEEPIKKSGKRKRKSKDS